MGRKTRKCPYCKSKVSYFEALSEMQNGEHTCRNCYKNSNISFNKTIYIPAAVALIIAIAVAAMFFWLKIITNLILALVLILVPFGVFYFITPLFFSLEEIKNEAQTPVMIEPKRAARAEKQSRILKSDEVAKVEKVKTEKKSSDKKKKSGGGKFSQFVRTYIIVPDDDEEIDNKVNKKNSEPETDNNSDSDFIIEENIEPEVITVSETEEIVSEINDESTEKSVSENITPVEAKVDDKTKNSDDRPKLNFNKLFSKLNFSDNKKNELTISGDNSDTVGTKFEISGNLNTPVYHRLTKTNKVNFIYYPDKKAIISVDLSVSDNTAEEVNSEIVETIVDKTENEAVETVTIQPKNETAKTVADELKTETVEIAAQDSNNEITEAIEMVVEKAIEAEKDEKENREIVNFFADKNDEQVDKNISEIQSIDVQKANVTDDVSENIDNDWVDYAHEKGDFITLSFSEPKKSDTNNIISLSDVNFDIAESEENSQDNIETKDSFVDYEFEDKLPVIIVEDSKKTLSELDEKLFEKNPIRFEWNVFSAESSKLGLKPEKANFDTGNLIDPVVNDEIDYKSEYEIFSQNIADDSPEEKAVSENIEIPSDNKGETKEKHKFGLFSKYVSKIKSDSVFNFDKSGKSDKNSVEKPKEIIEFKDDLPDEEVKVDEIIEFSSDLETEEDIINESSESDNTANEPDEDEALSEVTEIELQNISVQNTSVKNNISPETKFEMNYDTVANDVVNVKLESVEIPEKEVEDEEIEIFKPEEFMYGEIGDKEIEAEDESVNVEENEDYYKFNEEDDDVPEIEDEEFSEEDEDYYKFDEENDDVPKEDNVSEDDDVPEIEDEEFSEEDENYYKFDEENDDIPEEDNVSKEENVSVEENAYKEDEEYFKFSEEDDEDILVTETVEGAIEYIPEEEIEDSFVIDYSSDKSEEFEDISSGEQLDENFNLEEFRAKSIEEKPIEETVNEEPIIPVKIDSSGNRIDEPKKTSHYEKKFPNAAKAAAEQAAVSELKSKKEQQKAKSANKAKKKKSESDSVKSKDVQKKETPKPKETSKVQEQKTGFFSGLKNKIIEATEEERQAAFEEEERERKLAEREARRKAKEKDKEKAEKLKEKTKTNAEVNTTKVRGEKSESKSKEDAEERKRKSQKTKRIEKNKVKILSNVPADGKTIVFENSEKTVTKEYELQEKIVLDSVKDKVKELENKKVTEAEKVKIISEKVDEEKRLEKIEKLKTEQEEQRVRKEKKRREKQLQNERLEKAEEIRREQVKQVRRNQDARKKLEEKRDPGSVSLKEVNNVRSKVSQKKKKREQEADELL